MNKLYVSPDSDSLFYMGRTELYGGFPRFVYAATSVTVRFKGTAVSAKIRNHKFFNEMHIGVVIDGRHYKVSFEHSEEEITILLADKLEADAAHELIFYKSQDASHYFEFLGFEIENGELLAPNEPPKLKIECYGDSVSAGEVVDAVEFTAKADPDGHGGVYDDAWYSFPWITARNLGAQLYNIAQGGISIFDNTGYYHAPDYIGMEMAYNKVCYFPEALGGMSEWDFSRYTPDIVIFAVGQNDPHNEYGDDFDIDNPDYRLKWKNGYKKIINDLRSKYPKAYFVLILTVLEHENGWDKAVEEISAELDEKVSYLKFTRAGKATPGHPRIYEQYEMAEELTAYLSKLICEI
ncbi:MAG: electron transporter RnfD [Ruminococcus sp.]|nr:electron transporter RnfD [Ruminococcus sp.]